jgi:hypothetical protein
MAKNKSNSSNLDKKDADLKERLKVKVVDDSSENSSQPAAASPELEDNLVQTAPELPNDLAKKTDLPKTEEAVPDVATAASVQSEASTADRLNGPQYDDRATDDAVDDIAEKEGDTILALEDARVAHLSQPNNKSGWKDKLGKLLKNKWTWAAVLAVLVIIFAVPYTRYSLLGLVIKEPIAITVIDNKTDAPVSDAEVKLAGASSKTNAYGHANLKAGLGKHTLQVTKQYYDSLNQSYFVGFKSSSTSKTFKVTATGRLVPIAVTNLITGKPVTGAEIKLKGTTAKTNNQGKTIVALPTIASSFSATMTMKGYNTKNISVTVTDLATAANDFQLTPAGQVYFLSNLSGTVDVDKANLDGTNESTVLAGTGQENQTSTELFASSDWHYLVLYSSRDGGQPGLYFIDTSNDKVTEFDNGSGNITPVGWYGHNFIYDSVKTSQPYWQAGREALKSYDADTSQLNQLDESMAQGNADSYAYQSFSNFFIVNALTVYSTEWTTFSANGSSYDDTGLTDSIRAVQPNGQGKKDYQTFPVDSTDYIQAQAYLPNAVYFSVFNNTSGVTTYYSYQNQAVSSSNISDSTFSMNYPNYIASPSGNLTFWSEILDGQDGLFTGDSSANFKKQIASLEGYTPYGWYSDNYLIVSKNNSGLYVMPSSGLGGGRQPLKITDYFQPSQPITNNGYGYDD